MVSAYVKRSCVSSLEWLLPNQQLAATLLLGNGRSVQSRSSRRIFSVWSPSSTRFAYHSAKAGDTPMKRCISVGYTTGYLMLLAGSKVESVDSFTKKPLVLQVM